MADEFRVISKFLILPKKLNNEWKWLERVKIQQKKVMLTSLAPEGIGVFKYLDWVDLNWSE